MAFNFGNTSTFGANKPTAFGSPLSFGTPATTASTTFGFGSTFGAGAAQQQPTFGAGAAQQQPTFGAAAGTQQPAFGTSVTQQPAFGVGPAAAPAFGSTFGQPAAGATAPTFGSTFGQQASTTPAFGSTFGAAPSAAPVFGSSFGVPATSAPAFGSTFGTAASAAPAFGTTFGAAASTTPAFGMGAGTAQTFGATAGAAPAFGATAGAAPAFGSTFGTPSAAPSLFGSSATAKPTLFGKPATTTTNLFGAPAATATNMFGATTTQTPSLFGGTAVTSTAPNLFGAATTSAPTLFGGTFGTATTAAPSLFGGTTGFGLGTTTAGGTGFGLFGTGATTTAPSLFTGFGKTATTTAGFTGFGTSTAFGGFGTTTTAPAPNWFGGTTTFGGGRPPGPTASTATPEQLQIQQALASILSISVFGDERDNILKKWNMLQASWGTGKGYYSMSQTPVDYNSCNPFFRYKCIGYVVIPGDDNSNGLIKLVFNKKETELSNQKDVLTNGILGVLGNKPNLTVHITDIKGIGDNQCEVIFFVCEKGVTATTRRVPSLDLHSFLQQPVQKQQLNNVGVTFIGAYVMPSKSQLHEYLKTPPIGIEAQAWHAAQADNPNPSKYMPAAINGFTDLKKRMLRDQHETCLHRGCLVKIGKDLDDLKKKHANSTAKIHELKQKYAQLHHRLLQIIVKQEVTRKVGMAVQPDEEMLRGRLESLVAQLSVPTQYMAQLQEIKSNMNLTGIAHINQSEHYNMEPTVQDNIKQFLKMEQNAIARLINTINTDMKHLKIISDGLAKIKK